MTPFARRVVDHAISLIIAAAVIFPIAWGLMTSFKPSQQILTYPPSFLPSEPTLNHYRRVLDEGAPSYIANSLIVTVGTVALTLGLGFFAAYAMSRARFGGRQFVLALIVAVMSIPIASLLVPTFTLLSFVGLTDSRSGLALLYSAYQLPMVIWMLMGFIDAIPRELENAAMIDGYPRRIAVIRIVLPLARPALVAAGLFVVTFAWNDFVVAATMTSSPEVRTFPVAVYNFMGFFGREWGPLLAASMLSIVPIIAVFVAFQRHFVGGLTGGGVKG